MGLEITDVPNLDELHSRVLRVFGQCRNGEAFRMFPTGSERNEEVSIQVDSVFVVGSYARGIASRESDLDLLITFSNTNGGELEPTFEQHKTAIVACMQEKALDIVGPWVSSMGEDTTGWFTTADILDTIPRNELLQLERFTDETREEREVGQRRAFDLASQQYVHRTTILDQLNQGTPGKGKLAIRQPNNVNTR